MGKTFKVIEKICIFMLVLFLSAGCAKPFQPPPPEFKQWVKTGVSVEQVKGKMLLCGFDNLFGNAKMADDDYASAQNCMLKDGFSHTSNYDICKQVRNLPSCNYQN